MRTSLVGLLAVAGLLSWLKLKSEIRSSDEQLAAIHEAAIAVVDRPEQPVDRANGFWLTNSLVPREDILRGGPGRDGIPAIDEARFVPAAEADHVPGNATVISVNLDGEARAYPLRILVWHEIVNDRIGTNSFCVTYCPLCASCIVFDRNIGNRVARFGVSGLLYQSDMLMFDRETESLWSQLKLQAVSGPLAGTELRILTAEQMTFAAWKQQFPAGHVLSEDTGFFREYGYMPYANYRRTDEVTFPIRNLRDDLKNKELIAGIVLGGQAYALALSRLAHGNEVTLDHGDLGVAMRYDEGTRRLRVWNAATRKPIPHIPAYWFAWQAFHPTTRVWPPE